MIDIKLATRESRKRDIKRHRVILKLSDREWHLSLSEAKCLNRKLQTAIRRAQ